ncbi:cD99 antigen-like protein 2 [Caudoviricetes sp.]|nr:cD99 antigen-like protein 2 [Caudoviricetes sp.]
MRKDFQTKICYLSYQKKKLFSSLDIAFCLC